MTFIAALTTRHTIWMVADRRLSYPKRAPRDDARKITFLETTDGVAILGYAGLGATARGTEISDWMGRVVRGRNWPMEPSLQAISRAMKDQLPRHLRSTAVGTHLMIAPAFVDGHVRLYGTNLAVSGPGVVLGTNHTRFTINHEVDQPPRLGFAGSGAASVPAFTGWQRELFRLANAHDRKAVPASTVANALAQLALRVSKKDPFTGPSSIVAWRYSQQGRHKGGGAHEFYLDGVPDRRPRSFDEGMVPTIGRGMDVSQVVRVLVDSTRSRLTAAQDGKPVNDQIDAAGINAALAKLPWEPDEELK